MKHFVIEVTYIAPLEAIDAQLAAHRAFLQTGYDQGIVLCSGPQEPRKGGIIIARGRSRDDVQSFFRADPFQTSNLARYRLIEFSPVKRQGFLEEWLTAE